MFKETLLIALASLAVISVRKYLKTKKLRDIQVKNGSECARVRYTVIAVVLLICRLFGKSQTDVVVSGAKWLHKKMLGRSKAHLTGLKARKGDVWVVAWAKSGTNFTLQLCNQLARRGSLDSFTHIMDECPWPESEMMTRGYAYSYEKEPKYPTVGGMRVVKTHCPLDWLPNDEDLKYVCVMRDPKDVVVSAHPFLSSVMLGPAVPPLSAIVEMVCTGAIGDVSLPRFFDSCWRRRAQANVLVLFYEDMLRDLTGTVQKVADFLQVELSADELERVVEHTSFRWMKEHAVYFDAGALGPLGDTGVMVRKGKATGGAKLTDEQRRRVDEAMMAELKALGSDFPYEEKYVRED